jgi:hypothetical protein
MPGALYSSFPPAGPIPDDEVSETMCPGPVTMAEAKYLAEEWKAIYSHERPHGSLAGMTPKRYWETWTQENQLAIA